MKVEFETWGEGSITLEGNNPGHLRMTVRDNQNVVVAIGLNEFDMERLKNGMDLFR